MQRAKTVFIALLALPELVISDLTSIELSWPEPHAQLQIVDDADLLISQEALDSYGIFPCNGVPIPDDVERIPFPIQGGRIQLDRTSTEWNSNSSINRTSVGAWMSSWYFGQFQGLDTDINTYNYTQRSGRLYWNATNFGLGAWCSDPMRPLEEVWADWKLGDESGPIDLTEMNMEGVEATLGISLVHFLPQYELKSTESILYQCVYIRFTSNPADLGPCGLGGPSSPTGDSDMDIDNEDPPDKNQDEEEEEAEAGLSAGGKGKTIGIAAGAVSGVVLIALVLLFLFIRRRKASRRQEILAGDALSDSDEEKKVIQSTEKTSDKKDKKEKKVVVETDLVVLQKAVALRHKRKGSKKDEVGDEAGSIDGVSVATAETEPLPRYEEKLSG